MFKHIDWLFLRRPFVIFGILLISAVAFYFAGDQYRLESKEQFDSSKNVLSSSYNKLSRQSKEIALVDQYLDNYNGLVNTGFIGGERRLSWIESMKATNKEIKLPFFNYSIKPQNAFDRPSIKKSKTVYPLSSSMTLSLGLLHEEDLFNVFEILDEKVQSRFIIDSCDFKLKNRQLKTDKTNITSSCIVRWININVASKK